MSDLVPPSEIELIVGVNRHPTEHWGRADSVDHQVYVLHSRVCLETGRDLRSCPYSLALDRGIDLDRWVEDQPVPLAIAPGVPPRLVPAW